MRFRSYEEKRDHAVNVEMLNQVIAGIESLNSTGSSAQQDNPTDTQSVGGFTPQNGAGAAGDDGLVFGKDRSQ